MSASHPIMSCMEDKLSENHIIEVNNVREMDFHLSLAKNT